LRIFSSVDCQFVYYFSIYSVCFHRYSDHLISMPNYNANEFVDILLVIAASECRGNYCRVAVLYRQRFYRRNHSNDKMIHT